MKWTRAGAPAHSRSSLRRHGLQLRLVAAVIADQDDVAKAGLAQAPRRALEHALERRVRDARSCRETSCAPVGGSMRPSGT